LALPELRDAMRLAGLAEAGLHEDSFPAPPRGPAVVWSLPWSFAQPSPMFATDTQADRHALREAMLLAGLSGRL
jgi:hypothetical protein